MESNVILSEIEAEISRLQQVRSLLVGQNGHVRRGRKPGRPAKRRHTMSAEGRTRIAAAQRKRWAKQERTAKKAA